MRVLAAALDLVLPQRCAGCGTTSALLCAACAALLAPRAQVRFPHPVPPGLPSPWSVAPYTGSVRELIVAHKERGLTGLARPLGTALARAVRAARGSWPASGEIVVVPVPSSRASVRRRGRDPTLRIAREAVRRLTADGAAATCVRALGHRRRVADQAGLTAADRAANLSGALRALGDLRGSQVVVVDDVITTGSTLAEAARALRAAGAEVTAAAVIAATRRHTGA